MSDDTENHNLNLAESSTSYWRYFIKPELASDIRVECRICCKKLVRGENQSTSPLRRHLKCKHKQYWKLVASKRQKEYEEKNSQEKTSPIPLSDSLPETDASNTQA